MKISITGQETWGELHAKFRDEVERLEEELKQKDLTIAALSSRPDMSPNKDKKEENARWLLAAAALQAEGGDLVIEQREIERVDFTSDDVLIWKNEHRRAMVVSYHKGRIENIHPLAKSL